MIRKEALQKQKTKWITILMFTMNYKLFFCPVAGNNWSENEKIFRHEDFFS